MNKTLFLIRGLPGNGKSFTANLLSENGKYPVLSADMFFEDENGNYNWDATKIKEAHAWCKDETKKWLSRGMDATTAPYPVKNSPAYKIFVANTFTQDWEMDDYYQLAEQYGYDVVSLIVENRHGGVSVHDVPPATIEKMRERFSIKL